MFRNPTVWYFMFSVYCYHCVNQVSTFSLCFTNAIQCFTNALHCFTNTPQCFTNVLQCFTNALHCFMKIIASFFSQSYHKIHYKNTTVLALSLMIFGFGWLIDLIWFDFWCLKSLSTISISWWPVLVVEEPGESHRPWASNWQALSLAAASRVHPF